MVEQQAKLIGMLHDVANGVSGQAVLRDHLPVLLSSGDRSMKAALDLITYMDEVSEGIHSLVRALETAYEYDEKGIKRTGRKYTDPYGESWVDWWTIDSPWGKPPDWPRGNESELARDFALTCLDQIAPLTQPVSPLSDYSPTGHVFYCNPCVRWTMHGTRVLITQRGGIDV